MYIVNVGWGNTSCNSSGMKIIDFFAEKTVWEDLIDNRDFGVLHTWESSEK